MPSYRIDLNIHAMRPGYAPPTVLELVSTQLRRSFVVEANEVTVVQGIGVVRLRITVEAASLAQEDDDARRAAMLMQQAAQTVAVSGGWRIYRRVHARWEAVLPRSSDTPGCTDC